MLRTQALGLNARLRSLSLSIAGPVLFALVVLKAAGATASGALDPDYWWHLRYALEMFETGAIPSVDRYSWTFEGHGYAVTQWLGQYAIGVAYLLNGTAGTMMLTAAVIGFVVWTSWRTARLFMGSPTLSLLVALFATQAFWDITARPQMFGFALCAALVYVLARWESERSERLLLVLPLIMALWVNLHGSYILGLLYLFAVALREVACAAGIGVVPALRENRLLLGAVAVATLATLLNPHGPGAWAYVVEISGFETTRGNMISEWLPTNIGIASGAAFLLVSIGTLAALVTSRKRQSPFDLAEAIVLFAFGMITLRHTYFASLALVPVLARALAGTELYRLLDARIAERMPAWLAAVALVTALALTPGLYRSSAAAVEAEVAKRYPVAAIRFLDDNRVEGRLLNDVTAGGWIIFNSRRKVFIDGRLDLYRDRHFFDWFFARQGAPMWREFMARWQPDIVLMQNQTPIRQLLLQGGQWALVHEDPSFSVLVRHAPQYAALIARHRRDPAPWAPLDANGRRVVQPLGW